MLLGDLTQSSQHPGMLGKLRHGKLGTCLGHMAGESVQNLAWMCWMWGGRGWNLRGVGWSPSHRTAWEDPGGPWGALPWCPVAGPRAATKSPHPPPLADVEGGAYGGGWGCLGAQGWEPQGVYGCRRVPEQELVGM